MTFNGSFGHAENLRDLVHGESTEVAELDDFCGAFVLISEPFERCMKAQKLICIEVAAFKWGDLLDQRDSSLVSSPFGARPLSCVIDEQVSHHLRCESDKVGSTAPIGLRLIDEPQISLVNQCGRLQGVSCLVPHLPLGETSQLVIDQG